MLRLQYRDEQAAWHGEDYRRYGTMMHQIRAFWENSAAMLMGMLSFFNDYRDQLRQLVEWWMRW